MTWKPLERSEPSKNGVPIDTKGEVQWANDEYVVLVREIVPTDPEQPSAKHLSIRRQDRQPCRDWRDFQRIKNQLAGPEWEAVEVYPAESRLVDMANQFHLWCFPFYLGIGFNQGRLVGNQAQADITAPGAVQRNPEKIDLNHGGLSKIKDMKSQMADGYGQPIKEEPTAP